MLLRGPENGNISVSKLFSHTMTLYRSFPLPDTPRLANPTILGLSPNIFRLVSDVSYLSYRSPLAESDEMHAEQLMYELDAIDLLSKELVSGGRVPRLQKCCADASRLYLIATSILLFKVIHPAIQATHTWIQQRVTEAVWIIETAPKEIRYDQYFCWPFLVLGCAVVQANHMDILSEKSDKVWQCSYCGDAKRVAQYFTWCGGEKNARRGTQKFLPSSRPGLSAWAWTYFCKGTVCFEFWQRSDSWFAVLAVS
jgi:Fungal specific transcription factor domain